MNMDPRWWFYAICEYARTRIDMSADDYRAYLAGEVLDNSAEGVIES